MATFNVTFVSEEFGINQTVPCKDDQTVLEASQEQGLDLPYSCLAGACSTCAGKVTEGAVNHADQTFLTDDQTDEGYILTCIAYPKSDCTILAHVEDDLY